MKKGGVVSLFYFSLLIALTAVGFGKVQDQDLPQAEPQTFKARVREVYLAVRAYRQGKALTLTKEDLRLWETFRGPDGREQKKEQKINSFFQSQETPLAIAITIDSSYSMKSVFSPDRSYVLLGNRLEVARHAGKIFFNSIFSSRDQGLISEFFQEPPRHEVEQGVHRIRVVNLRVVQNWTADRKMIFEAINKINKPAGLTPLRDAVLELTGYFDRLAGNFLRILLIVTDGGDSPSSSSGVVVNIQPLERVIEQLQNKQILVFGVGIYKKNFGFLSPERGKGDLLEKMSEATGGETFLEENLSRLTDIFRTVEKRIREVNFLSYTPQEFSPGFHALEVEVGRWEKEKWKREKGLKVFYRAGYTIEEPVVQPKQ